MPLLILVPLRIITGAQDQHFHGVPSFTVLQPFKSFCLLDFYFGCATRTDENMRNAAERCTITLRAFHRDNIQNAVATANFTFVPEPPNSKLPVSLMQAVLPEAFRKENGVVQITIEPDDVAKDGLLIDDLHYNLIE